jgi:hypothetical protein
VVTLSEFTVGKLTFISGLGMGSSYSLIVTMKKKSKVTKISIKGTIGTATGFLGGR